MIEKQRVRSPRYPSISLTEAERMARMIFDKDGMNAVDRESAVQHIGYSSLNGSSSTALASLKQYGLLSDAGKGMAKLTPLCLDLIEPESPEGRLNALRTAATSPGLFSSLLEKFPEKAPSETNLRAYLLRQEFTSSAVKAVVPAYLETCQYLATAEESESNGLRANNVSENAEIENKDTPLMTAYETQEAPSNEMVKPPASGRRMVFDTEEGEVIFTYPNSLSQESVEDIEEWFALVAKRLRRITKH